MDIHSGPFLCIVDLFSLVGPFFFKRLKEGTNLDLFLLSFSVLWTFSHRKVHMLDLFSLNACKKVPTLDLFLLPFYCFVDLFSIEGPCLGPIFSECTQEGTHPGSFLDIFLLFCGPFLIGRSICWTFFLWTLAKRYPPWTFSCYLSTVLWTFSPQLVHAMDLFCWTQRWYPAWTFSCYLFTLLWTFSH